MPDLNKMMSDVQKESATAEKQIKRLLESYSNLCREGTQLFRSERLATGNMGGLEDFYMFVQILKRNRDVIGSLLRGFGNLRSTDRFKFVEEDFSDIPKTKKKKKPAKMNKKKIEELKIPQEAVVTGGEASNA